MDKKKVLKDALKDYRQIALAYAVKTSSADTPEQFLDDYVKNLGLFEEIKKSVDGGWVT